MHSQAIRDLLYEYEYGNVELIIIRGVFAYMIVNGQYERKCRVGAFSSIRDRYNVGAVQTLLNEKRNADEPQNGETFLM